MAPHHGIPPGDVKEHIPAQPGIDAVDVTEIGASDDEKIIPRHPRGGEEATQHRQAGQEQIDVPRLQHRHRARGRDDDAARRDRAAGRPRYLSIRESLRIRDGPVGTPDTARAKRKTEESAKAAKGTFRVLGVKEGLS